MPQEALVRPVGRAHFWQELLDSGELKSIRSLASRFHVDHPYVACTIRLEALAPDIVEAILGGQEPNGLSLRRLRLEVPVLWEDQRRQTSAGDMTCEQAKEITLNRSAPHRRRTLLPAGKQGWNSMGQ